MTSKILTARVPSLLLSEFRDSVSNVSQAIRHNVLLASNNPEILVSGLRRRIKRSPNKDEMAAMGFRCPDDINEKLQHLSELTELPVEQVIRLIMEGHLEGSHV